MFNNNALTNSEFKDVLNQMDFSLNIHSRVKGTIDNDLRALMCKNIYIEVTKNRKKLKNLKNF